MAVEQQEFKFPDESVVKDKSESDLDIEVIDDTPPEDRGKGKMPEEIVAEVEKDDLEEYSDKVKKRLSQLKRVYHDERREKERYAREREEALKFAEMQHNEVKQLRHRLGTGERIFKDELTKSTQSEVESAKAKYKIAYEAGDAQGLVDAQEALTEAKLKLREFQNFQPSLQESNTGVQNNSQAQVPAQRTAPQPDPKAEAWRGKNSWFGTDEEMTALALGLHEKLVRSGVDPRTDDYYRRVDETMKKRFPENFSDEEAAPSNTRETPRKTAPTVVAPATRSTAPRQIRLTASQVALAKRLGLTNEAYAREQMKIEQENTNG